MSIGFLERTIIQTHDPENGDQCVLVLLIHGVSLALDQYMPLFIDGEKWSVVGRRGVEVDTQTRMITTTITAIKDA